MDMRFPIIPILSILIAAAMVIGVIFLVRFIIKKRQRIKVNGDRTAKKWYVMTALCVVIMLCSWILNMGWFRVILTWLPLPLIHTVFFILINLKAAAKASSSQRLEKYMILSCLTYLLPYLLFPDGGDIGGMYFFFGLIHNDTVAKIMMYITPILFNINIAVLILESIELRRCKS